MQVEERDDGGRLLLLECGQQIFVWPLSLSQPIVCAVDRDKSSSDVVQSLV